MRKQKCYKDLSLRSKKAKIKGIVNNILGLCIDRKCNHQVPLKEVLDE